MTETGVVVDAATPLADLPDGALLTWVGFDAVTTGPESSNAVAPQGRADHGGPWVLLVAIGAVLLASAVLALAQGGSIATPTARAAAAGVLALGALVSIGAWAYPLPRRLPDLAIGAPLTLAFAAAAVGTPVVFRGAHMAVTAGLVAAALVAVTAAALTRDPRARATASALAITLLVVAAVWGITLMVNAPAASAAAITMGLVAPGLRLVPALLLRVPEGYAIEYRHFLGNRWSVRGAIPDDPGAVSMPTVRTYVDAAQARLHAGVVTLSVMAAACAPFVAPLTRSDSLIPRIGATVLLVATAMGLTLWPRRTSRPVLRWTPRLSAAAIVVVVLAQVALGTSEPSRLGLAVAGLVVGTVAAMLIAPVAARRAALGWSRLGDLVESASVVLALPAGFLAAGTLEFVRAMVSG
ncbi:MAG: hypothetical protein ACK5IM_11695 [Demequina sp.]|uniref:hypothetical protein n=1 Tax=Demequina sp. TaxID=2050685 RepID=UPI003A86FDFF